MAEAAWQTQHPPHSLQAQAQHASAAAQDGFKARNTCGCLAAAYPPCDSSCQQACWMQDPAATGCWRKSGQWQAMCLRAASSALCLSHCRSVSPADQHTIWKLVAEFMTQGVIRRLCNNLQNIPAVPDHADNLASLVTGGASSLCMDADPPVHQPLH